LVFRQRGHSCFTGGQTSLDATQNIELSANSCYLTQPQLLIFSSKSKYILREDGTHCHQNLFRLNWKHNISKHFSWINKRNEAYHSTSQKGIKLNALVHKNCTAGARARLQVHSESGEKTCDRLRCKRARSYKLLKYIKNNRVLQHTLYGWYLFNLASPELSSSNIYRNKPGVLTHSRVAVWQAGGTTEAIPAFNCSNQIDTKKTKCI